MATILEMPEILDADRIFGEAIDEQLIQGPRKTAPTTNRPQKYRESYSACSGHIGELVQGPVQEPNGRIEVGLLSLVANLFEAKATFRPDKSGELRIRPANKRKALLAAQVLLRHLDRDLSGEITVTNPAPQGLGFGTSTMDVSAVQKVILQHLNIWVPPEILGALAVEAEAASDPLLFPPGSAILWGARCGKVLEVLPGPVPPAVYLAFDAAKGKGGIDTVQLAKRQRFNLEDTAKFSIVLGRLRKAVREQDVRLLGEATTMSAIMNQSQIRIPGFCELLSMVRQTSACGVSISHSGTLVSVMFDPNNKQLYEQIISTISGLIELGFKRQPIYLFSTINTGENHESC